MDSVGTSFPCRYGSSRRSRDRDETSLSEKVHHVDRVRKKEKCEEREHTEMDLTVAGVALA